MYRAKQISILAVALIATGVYPLGAAQVTNTATRGDAVMVKPGPPSGDLVDILTGKSKEQKAQKLAWDERIGNIQQVLVQFPELRANDSYYPGWQRHYIECVDTQINTAESSSRNWNLSSGNYGLSPDGASALPSANIVGKCLTNIKAKYEQNQNEQANERASEQARRDKLATCEESPEGQLAQLSAEIVANRGANEFAQAAIDHDKKVEAVSGVVDLDTRHQMGEALVIGREAIDSEFKKYRQLGGQATSADAVLRSSDPCKALRQ